MNAMKRVILIAVTTLSIGIFSATSASAEVKIDATNFPDELVRDVVSKSDSDKDEILSDLEISNTKELEFKSDKKYMITNMKGVSYFSHVKEVRCNNVVITENLYSYFPDLVVLRIDASSVVIKGNMKELSYLIMEYPIRDENSEIDIQTDKLSYMHISADIFPKICKIKAKNLNGLALKTTNKADVSGIQCFTNKLKKLEFCSPDTIKFPFDLSACSNLDSLTCSFSSKLKSINLKGLKNLKYLMLYDCNISTLDLSDLKKLELLDCPYNNIKKINLKNCKKLTRVDISYNPIKKINLTKNKNLLRFAYCGLKIKKLDLSKNIKLGSLGVMNSKITTLIMPKSKKHMSRTWPSEDVGPAPEAGDYKAKIKILDLSNLKTIKHLKSSDSTRLTLKGDFFKKRYGLKKVIISKKLKKADKKYIKKLAKKCKAKVVVKK